MSGISHRAACLVLLTFCLSSVVLPLVIADFPDYSLEFQLVGDESKIWTISLLNMRIGPPHIYGNFTVRLTDPVDINYVLFRCGEANESDPLWDIYLPLILNDTSEPYEWTFSTTDFPVGIQAIVVDAFYTEGNGISITGSTLHFFFEHQDRSSDSFLYAGISISIVAASVFVVGFVCYKLVKQRSSRPHTSHFERDVWYG